MSRICGIELKSATAVLVVLDSAGVGLVDVERKKITLEDDESGELIKCFFAAVVSFIKVNQIDTVVIKKRAKKGRMAGGAISFKMEALIQLNGEAEVEFVSGQAIAAAHKKSPFELPSSLKKYQEAAFMAASLFCRKK